MGEDDGVITLSSQLGCDLGPLHSLTLDNMNNECSNQDKFSSRVYNFSVIHENHSNQRHGHKKAGLQSLYDFFQPSSTFAHHTPSDGIRCSNGKKSSVQEIASCGQ